MGECKRIDFKKVYGIQPLVKSEPKVCVIQKDENYQTISHPSVSHLPRMEKVVKNRFLEALYRKYPHILPKREPMDMLETLTAPHKSDYQSIYQTDFGSKNEILNIIRCPGVRNPGPERFQSKDPYTPSMPGMFDNSLTKYPAQKWSPQAKIKPFSAPCNVRKWGSEYRDNYTRMAKLFKIKGIYKGNGRIFMKHQRTTPPFQYPVYGNYL